MHKNMIHACAIALSSLMLILLAISPVLAPSIFVIGQGSTEVGGIGWFAGYVISGQSGSYTLNISATGGSSMFPITNVKLIALASNWSVAGGLKSLSIEGTPIIGFTPGIPPYYPPGGAFSEPDYYGYNDSYVIPQLTFAEANYPNTWKQVHVTVEFQPGATEGSKIAFLCYGTDAKDQPVKTPFSGGTMFTIPDLASTLVGLSAMGGAYELYRLKKRKKP